MQFVPTPLKDAFIVESQLQLDTRGSFARLRCSREFASNGLPADFVQTNLSYNERKGTFRGLHFQIPPSKEGKLVRCIKGSMRDLIVDLRPNSDTFLQHAWIDLSAERPIAVFVPPGFAHGFLTQESDVSVLYEMTDYYAPELARGMRWNDPLLAIRGISGIESIHPRDASYPDLGKDQLEVFRL